MATFNRLSTNLSSPDATSDSSQYLLHIAADDEELHNLIWNPAGPYLSHVSRTKIVNFHNMLIKWKNRKSRVSSRFDNEDCLRPGKVTYWMLDHFTFPPQPHSDTREETCLTLSLYTFYNMRLMWALSIYGDRESSELNAYYFLYQCLRFVATFLENCTSAKNNQKLMCENMKYSIAAMLHIAGNCCPNPRWVCWIAHTLKEIGSHGLFDGNAFATNLDVLLTLERPTTNSALERYRRPSQRAVSVLFPRVGGKDFLSYYGGPTDSVGEHCPLGIATWSKNSSNPDINLNLVPATHAQPFNFEWLANQAVVKEWMDWTQNWEFDLNRALADHISGSTWS
ncbi:hypothetical protein BDW74DRAFT_183830 [Aspergillus multicolor]|uniref:uncharacterized protein n=1 Tax=Aspergillus multicolor TaxID=41759 RepID=UPI003CCC9926